MNIYFIRHGEADHLKEDWYWKLFTRKEFILKMIEWENVNLTEQGYSQAESLSKRLPRNYKLIYSSPLPRTRQTANKINIHNKVILYDNSLKEIITSPPKIFSFIKLPIIVWIYICIIVSLFNGQFIKFFNQCRDIYKIILTHDDDILVVSHTMRIRTLIYYAYLCPKLKVLSTNYNTCGVSVICKRLIKISVKQPCNVPNI